MRGEDLRIAPSETWNGRRWTILEEKAGSNGIYRYFIDPKTALIWRTVATNPAGTAFYDGQIERLTFRTQR
jgi:hypothetical protein